MYDLDKEFQLKNIYFYINKTLGNSTPLLLNEDSTCFENLYSGEKFITNKCFPFKIKKHSEIITHNFAQSIKKQNDNILVHRLWWLLKYSKYLKNVSFIKQLKLKHLNKNNIVTFKDIIEINDIITQSKQLSKEFKKEQQLKTNTKTL